LIKCGCCWKRVLNFLKVWEIVKSEDKLWKKCTKSGENLLNIEMYEMLRKCAKCWESVLNVEKVWERAQNVEKVWESIQNDQKI